MDDQGDQDESKDNQQTLSTYDEQKQQQQQQHRANTTMHVCWHRNTSVSATDNHRSLVNQLSGYLLRKFKNSNGWQKLWVVFTNFCLFFYKTYQVCSFFILNLFS
jgi:FERM/RhoGEF/pleckstrin domain protein 2